MLPLAIPLKPKTLVDMSQDTFGLYFGTPESGGPLGSTSFLLLHLDHHMSLFYMDRAMAATIFNVFHGQSHLVESTLYVANTQSPTQNFSVVAFLLYCCLYCR